MLKNNYKVTIIDSFINSGPIVVDRIKQILQKNSSQYEGNLTYIKGDIRDFQLLDNLFKRNTKMGQKIYAVIHLGGLKSIAESKDSPLKYWDFNVSGTINLLKVMSNNECNKFIYSGSATVYGETNKPPFKEYFDLYPISPYANTKAVVEKILIDISHTNNNNWKIVNLRYFNPIGTHESGLIGESPLGTANNLFPRILKTIKNKEKLLIFGNDWPTPDGTCIRDYIHVEDLADGHIKVLEKQFEWERGYYCFNLGTGKGTSVLELIRSFEESNKVKISYEFAPRRKGDCPVLIGDNYLAIQKLKWQPIRTLEDMCKDGYRWFLKNPDGLCSKYLFFFITNDSTQYITSNFVWWNWFKIVASLSFKFRNSI